MEPTWYLAFMFAFCGSAAVEIILILQVMGPRGAIPGKYKTWLFWSLRATLAVISGVFAIAYYASSPQLPLFLYVHLGAATPAILTRISRIEDDEADSSPKS